jgi:hypothetical protein
VELGGDERRIREQVDDASLPLRIVPGRAGVGAVALDVAARRRSYASSRRPAPVGLAGREVTTCSSW